jgi:hypothetical protein
VGLEFFLVSTFGERDPIGHIPGILSVLPQKVETRTIGTHYVFV